MLCAALLFWPALSPAAAAVLPPSANYGPYNVSFLEGGIGVERPLSGQSLALRAAAPWSMAGWLRISHRQSGQVIVAAVGDIAAGEWRGLALMDDSLLLVLGPGSTVRTDAVLDAGRWYAVAISIEGNAGHVYLDGREVGAGSATSQRVRPSLQLAPAAQSPGGAHFGGSLAQWTLADQALGADAVGTLARIAPDFSLITFTAVGVGWPWQEHAWRGLQQPQDPWTLPQAKTPPSTPSAVPARAVDDLNLQGPHRWAIGAWRLMPVPEVSASVEQLSTLAYDVSRWYDAVVPGTVLTTLIARGVYPGSLLRP